MLVDAQTSTLPPAFRNIQFITSAILREDLTRTIADICQLIKDTESFPPDPELVIITNRFFAYLTSSCENRSTLTRRATWMLTQATIIHARLIEFSYRHRVERIDDYTHVMYADMIDMIATMSQKLADYTQYNPADNFDNLTDLMSAIVETASTTKPAQSQHYYSTVKIYGDKIIDTLDHLIRNKKVGVQGDTRILADNLNKFWYRLRNYRHRVVN